MSASVIDPICSILLDIEGTTTSISFVYEVLFPFARERAKTFLRQNISSPRVREVLTALRQQHASDQQQALNPPLLVGMSLEEQLDSTIAYLNWLMDRDSKAPPLKTLQGMIWEEGYRRGELASHVFPDVPRAFSRWRQQSKSIAIFSSGSVLAQKLLFAHTVAGDLTPYIHSYFDTITGKKNDPGSYRTIAQSLGHEPGEVLFVSDVAEELDAATSIGMKTVLSIRPGNRLQASLPRHISIASFDELC